MRKQGVGRRKPFGSGLVTAPAQVVIESMVATKPQWKEQQAREFMPTVIAYIKEMGWPRQKWVLAQCRQGIENIRMKGA